MSYRDVLVLLLLIQGLATQLQSEKQIGGSFPRYRRQTSDLDLGHTEVGTRISRTCEYRDIYSTHYILVWEVQTARVRRTVATCLAYPEPFICSVSSGFSSLFSVTTKETQTTLAWNADTRFFSLRCVQGKEIANWTLVTYSKPTDLTCRSPEFTDNSNTVSVTCVSSVIFPEDPRCVLYIQTAVVSVGNPGFC
ncbi:uncharacterized protein LOC106012546 [Aplysia californica]|uniref:Uncharacterized protein LOC106012546 n=1 Tax=Aplysia californica TaxID=6500 RepID=A0ABM1VXM8_APLCA|nr:uncharacterized protein LOC106012546 [Aplysia californica]